MIPLNIFFVFLNESSYKCPASSKPAVCIIDLHISVCERAPGEGRLARGPRGNRLGGQRRPRPEKAEAGRERVVGRRIRAGGNAAAPRPDTAPRLGASSCSAAAASSRAASAGRLLGLSQHFPAVSHTPLFERSFTHTHYTPRPHAPLEKKNGNQSERGGGGKSLTEVRRLGSPFEAAGGRAPAARGQLSLSGEAPQPPQRPAGLASLAPTLRPGAGGGGDPSSHFGSPGRG